MKKLSLLGAALVLLTACQSPPPVAPVELTPSQRFVMDTQYALRQMGLAANDERLVGSILLQLKLDRQGAIVECKAEPYANGSPEMPAYNERLGRRIADLCWATILPLPPEELWGEEAQVTVVAPLIFVALDEHQLTRQRIRTMRLKRDHYLWHSLFAGLPLDSVGQATFHIRPDDQGRVQICRVTLRAQRNRADAFRADETLRRRLQAGCERLNPLEMPHLIVQQPMREYSATVDYAPWKSNLKSY